MYYFKNLTSYCFVSNKNLYHYIYVDEYGRKILSDIYKANKVDEKYEYESIKNYALFADMRNFMQSSDNNNILLIFSSIKKSTLISDEIDLKYRENINEKNNTFYKTDII